MLFPSIESALSSQHANQNPDFIVAGLLVASFFTSLHGIQLVSRVTSGYVDGQAVWPYRWIFVLNCLLQITVLSRLFVASLPVQHLVGVAQHLGHTSTASLLDAVQVGLGSAMHAILIICTGTRHTSPHYGEMATLYALLTLNNVVMAVHEVWWPSEWLPYKQEGLYLGVMLFCHFTVLTLDTLARRYENLPVKGLWQFHLGGVISVGLALFNHLSLMSYRRVWYVGQFISTFGLVGFMYNLLASVQPRGQPTDKLSPETDKPVKVSSSKIALKKD